MRHGSLSLLFTVPVCVVQHHRVAEESPGNRQERLAERHGTWGGPRWILSDHAARYRLSGNPHSQSTGRVPDTEVEWALTSLFISTGWDVTKVWNSLTIQIYWLRCLSRTCKLLHRLTESSKSRFWSCVWSGWTASSSGRTLLYFWAFWCLSILLCCFRCSRMFFFSYATVTLNSWFIHSVIQEQMSHSSCACVRVCV